MTVTRKSARTQMINQLIKCVSCGKLAKYRIRDNSNGGSIRNTMILSCELCLDDYIRYFKSCHYHYKYEYELLENEKEVVVFT